MNGLLDVAVAGEPVEVVPVADHPFQITDAFRPFVLGRHGFHGAGQIGAVAGADFADLTVVNALEQFLAGVVVAPAEAGHHGQFLPLRDLDRLAHQAHTRNVRSHRLLGEYVFVRLHCFDKMSGAKSGWRRENDYINTAVQDLFVTVETDKFVAVLHLDLHIFDGLGDAPEAGIDLFRKGVCHRGDLDVAVCLQSLGGGAGTTTTAANQAELELLVGRFAESDGREGHRGRDGGATDGGAG